MGKTDKYIKDFDEVKREVIKMVFFSPLPKQRSRG
jgi:hypothetical protein